MKNGKFILSVIVFLGLVAAYFSTKYFAMKQEQENMLIETSDLKLIYSVLDSQQDAWNNGDHDGFMEGYWKSDSLKFITDKGVKYGWKNVLEMYKNTHASKEEMGDLSFSKDGAYPMTKNKDAILIVGRWQVVKEVTEEGTFAFLFRMKNGQWKITEDRTF